MRVVDLAAALLLGLVSLAAGRDNGKAPEIHHTYFKEALTKMMYFKNPRTLLGLDKSRGHLYRSTDYGANWGLVEGVSQGGSATRLYAHPHEGQIAFVMTEGTEHWVTKDEGQTWSRFSTPLAPTTSGVRPLEFHAERTRWVIFMGEKCQEETTGWWPFPRVVCHDEAFYVRDGFDRAVKDYESGDREGTAIVPLLGQAEHPVAKCLWARHTPEFEAMAEEAVFCMEVVPQGTEMARRSIHDESAGANVTTGARPRRDEAHGGDGLALDSGGGTRHLQGRSLEDDLSHLLDGLASHNTVRLVVSEDFFAKEKRVVHFGSGNDGAGGDRAGGGVVAISVIKGFVLVGIGHAHSAEMDLFVSVDGHVWAESHLALPPGAEEDAYTILESTRYAVFVDVVTSSSGGVWGTLFRSNSNGTYYTQSLEHTHHSRNGMVDVERVHGIEGVVIANQVANPDKAHGIGRSGIDLRSRISFNDGARWRFLQAPAKDADGRKYGCSQDAQATGQCALHVHSVTSTRTPGRVFGARAAPGVVAAVGSVGQKLAPWRESDTFVSRDGGLTWQAVHSGAHHVVIADGGGAIVLMGDTDATDLVRFSLDGGSSWRTAALEASVRVKSLFVDDEALSPTVMAVGTVKGSGRHSGEQVVVAIDFGSAWGRQCAVDVNDPKEGRDMETFGLSFNEDNDCIMGHKVDYVRRRADAQCTMKLETVLAPVLTDCACTAHDFECDYNYAPRSDGTCELAGAMVVPKGDCQRAGDRFLASSGYRLIPGDTCERRRGSVELDKPVERDCPDEKEQRPGGGSHTGGDGHVGPVSHHTMEVKGKPRIMAFPNSTSYLMMTTAQELFRTDDEGARWEPVTLGPSSVGKPVYLAEHLYDSHRAFAYTDAGVLLFTGDRGASWSVIKSLPSPANQLRIRPLVDFNPENPDWLLFVGGTECPDCHTEIWVSRDNGNKWNRVATHATKCRFARSREFTALPAESVVCSVLKHAGSGSLEQDRQDSGPEEIRVFTQPFKDSSHHTIAVPDAEQSELLTFHVYSRFIVFAVVQGTAGDDADVLRLFVSSDGYTMHEALFPPGTTVSPKGFTLLPAHGGTILVDVEGSSAEGSSSPWVAGWGTLFASNSNGTHLHRVLQHTNHNHLGVSDVERVDGLRGLMIANRVVNAEALGKPGVNKRLRTVASWDDGRSWHPLAPPASTSDDECRNCSLNVYGPASMVSGGRLFSAPTAPGRILAVGTVATHLGRYTKAHTYLSNDGGISWIEARASHNQYEFADHGSLLILLDDSGPLHSLQYSYDGGQSWQTYRFMPSGQNIVVDQVLNGLESGGQGLVILGSPFSPAGGISLDDTHVITVDFSNLHESQCRLDTRNHALSDFELWTPHWGVDARGRDAPICVLGERISYWRRKPDAMCYVGDEFAPEQTQSRPCECTVADYECDVGFWLNDYGECVLDGPDPHQPADCREGTTYQGRSGYRKNHLSQCSGGPDLERPVERVCGRDGGIHADLFELDSPIADIQYFTNSQHLVARTERDHVFVSLDEGHRWSSLDPPELTGKEHDTPTEFAAIVRQPYFDSYAYFLPLRGTVALYTDDEARTTRLLHLPTSPAHMYQPTLRFHPDYPDWLIFLGQSNENCNHVDASTCQVEAFASKDHGAHWSPLYAPLGPGGCSFVRTDRIRKGHRSSIVCARHPSAHDNPGDVVVSDNWFRHDRVLVPRATDFAIMGEFILVSQDANNGQALTMHVSLDGNTAAVAQFPGDKQTMDPAYTVLEPPEGFEYRDANGHVQKTPGAGLMLHVTKSNKPGAEWGTIYSSNSNGTYYRRTLEHVNRDENGLVDFERIRALEGVILANTVSNPDDVLNQGASKQLQTRITIDGGSRWHYLSIAKGSPVPCSQTAPQKGDCALHLHGYTEMSDPENIYSASGAVGLAMGVGNVGPHLGHIGQADTYLSSDGGATWSLARKGPKWHEFGDHGALIVTADRIHPITEIEYSLDVGKTWSTLHLPDAARGMRVEFLTTTPDSTSRRFVLYGKRDASSKGIIVGLDFSGAQPRVCKFVDSTKAKKPADTDFELFAPKLIDPLRGEDECILGRKVQYYRRIADRSCYVGDEFSPTRFVSTICDCTERDYECNHNFMRESADSDNPYGKCVLIKGMQAPRTNCTEGQRDYFVIEAPYRKIPQSVCRNGLVLDTPKEVWCPGKARTMAIIWALLVPTVFLLVAYFGYKLWRDRYPYLRLEDVGAAIRPALHEHLRPMGPQSGLLKQLEPVFVGTVATMGAVGGAAKEGFLWSLDRMAPYLPGPIQHWSYMHPPRWGAHLSMDGRTRRDIRRNEGNRFSYQPLSTNEAASRVFGEPAEALDVYDEFEAGFNHFLEEEEALHGERDAQPVDRQVLFANTEISDDESNVSLDSSRPE